MTADVKAQAQMAQAMENGGRNNNMVAMNGQRQQRIVEVEPERNDDAPEDYFISDLYAQLTQVINSKPTEIDPLRIGQF